MKQILLILISLILFSAISCSGDQDTEDRAVLIGDISVSDSLAADSTFGKLSMTIFSQDSSGNDVDTLSRIEFDENGYIAATVSFPERAVYSYEIKEGDNSLIYSQILLANDDTVNITGSIPGLAESIEFQSDEYDALRVFNRVNNQYQRVIRLIGAGAVADSLIEDELNKWADSFREVYQTYPGSFAADLAFLESVQVLNLSNKDRMYERIEEFLPEEFAIGAALNYAVPYVAQKRGLEGAVQYLDSLEELSEERDTRELVSRVRINVLYDSSEVQRAKRLTDDYEAAYGDSKESQQWIKNIRYDLNYLAPGVRAPEFSFVSLEGDTLNNESYAGSPFLIEISPLASGLYQQEYDRLVAIHEIYKNYGLRIVTVPLDQSEVTIEAFYESRGKHWPAAQPGSYDVQELIENFNIQQVPTWLLIDKNGDVVRKFVSNEITDIVQSLGTLFSNSNNAS